MTRRGLLAALLLVAGSSSALADDDQETARHAFETGQALPFGRILERARREHPGRLLGAEIEKEGERLIYELRILALGGRIGEWRYDARTGDPADGEHHQEVPAKDED